jgi:hypothetical protein
MRDRESTFCDRAKPYLVAPLARSIVVAAGFLKELKEPSMKIHRPAMPRP